MPLITKIEYQKKRKDRVNVYVDGEFCLALPAIVVGEYRLKAGDEADASRLAVLGADAEREEAWNRGLDYASRSLRSCAEIRKYLAAKGYSQELARETVAKLKLYGFADDAAYARAYIADHQSRAGAKKLEFDLRAKGVAQGIYAPMLESLDSGDACRRLAAKYTAGKELDRALKAKTAQYLYGKGFDWDTVRAAVAALGGEDEYDG